MNDQYDVFCIEKLRESLANMSEDGNQEADNVLCACADYLSAEGYK